MLQTALSALSLISSVAIALLVLVKPTLGGPSFLIAVLIAPYVHAGPLGFRIELLLTPVLLLFAVLVHNRGRFVWPSVATAFAWWFLWMGLVTMLHSGDTGVTSIPWVSLYGFARPVLLLVLFASMPLVAEELPRLARLFVYLCIPLGVFAAVQSLGFSAATDVTLAGYSSPTRTPIGTLLSQFGAIVRGVSVFESPPYAATYFLLVLSTGLWILFVDRAPGGGQKRTLTLLGMGAALLGGLFTLSATFIGGLVIVLVQFLWLTRRRRAHFSFALAIVLVGMAGAALLYAMSQGGILSGTLAYQSNRLLTLSVFASRYAGGTGIESAALLSIADHPFSGVGMFLREGIFVGDSIFVVIPYWGGIVGAALFAYLLYRSWRSTSHHPDAHSLVALWVVVLLSAGLGSATFLTPRVSDWWWAMVGLGCAASPTKGADHHLS